ncbi:MAG TPA: pilus assembly protein N-terminal domain-containing protein [Nitrospiria bacterium]|nr:pilus assembly protein N-terminal domain-containing protein [Candidatus Deferrimicrobiaceae bacterium]HSG06322.1 pilus assembly protein N-terminal domain-containing protein [Nitrospiria bacterium]
MAIILIVVGFGLQVAVRSEAQQEGVPEKVPVKAIHVNASQSTLINTDFNIRRVSVARPETADVLVISPRQMLVIGKAPGITSLVYWSQEEVPTTADVIVGINLDKVRDDLRKIAPDEPFEITSSGTALILSGTVSSGQMQNRLLNAAKVYAPNTVDLLKVMKLEQVLLQIRVAEVDRSLAKELGLNMLFQPVINGQQYRGFLTPPGGFNSFTGNIAGGGSVDGSISDLTQLFLVWPGDIPKFAAMLRVLHDQGAIKTLSEPNLVVASGDEGKFLVGGEFPVVTASAAGSGAAASVDYKEFGISLSFKPKIASNGDIYMKINQEVSELDFANGIAISGFQLPALRTRKAESGLQLADGQTFVLAGLLDNKLTRKVSKIPILGDIPILGVFFRNSRYSNTETELMVMVTPKIVRPLNKEEIPALPTDIMRPEETSPRMIP